MLCKLTALWGFSGAHFNASGSNQTIPVWLEYTTLQPHRPVIHLEELEEKLFKMLPPCKVILRS